MNDYFLADDLSGALEVAAAFRQAGFPAVVTWSLEGWNACGPDDVVGFTTETRNAPPEVAAAAVRRALAHGRARGGRLLYKKIDSTMRGPVAAELAALAAELPATTILFTPANPHAGRMVRNGVLLVQGVPVAETDFGRDPANPVKESSILGVVPAAAKGRIIVLDVANDGDLEKGIAAREAVGDPWVAVGSGALARALAPRLGRARTAVGAKETRPALPPGPVLLVCGSAHPVNRAQAACLGRERALPVIEVRPSNPGVAATSAVRAIRSHGGAAIHIAPRENGDVASDSQAALAAMVEAARTVVTYAGVRRIMATGGETARALCDAFGIDSLRALEDIEPGLVLASASNASGAWLLAIKPGGFGSEASWVRAADALGFFPGSPGKK
ncbi:MAG: hypothetical protein EXS43_10020 [Opitutus sp.]|nr:hypothetical protein [Opitutus sp.]